jgi:small membrane protein
MTLIQVVLTACIIIIAAYMYLRLRNTFLDLILILLFLITGVVFVIFNEITDKMAHFLGIGRGADMIFYLGLLFLFFLMLKLYARLRKVEENLTELVRKKSIEDAEKFEEKN